MRRLRREAVVVLLHMYRVVARAALEIVESFDTDTFRVSCGRPSFPVRSRVTAAPMHGQAGAAFADLARLGPPCH